GDSMSLSEVGQEIVRTLALALRGPAAWTITGHHVRWDIERAGMQQAKRRAIELRDGAGDGNSAARRLPEVDRNENRTWPFCHHSLPARALTAFVMDVLCRRADDLVHDNRARFDDDRPHARGDDAHVFGRHLHEQTDRDPAHFQKTAGERGALDPHVGL